MQHHEAALKLSKSGTGAFIDLSGDWENDLKSTMHLIQNGDALEGTYESKVSSTGGSTIGDLKGYVDGDLIAFVVHWRDFQSITSWVGQCESGGSNKLIQTLWQMTKQVDEGDEWASINSGSDSFTKR